MSKAKRKKREAERKAAAVAGPLEVSRLEGRDARPEVAKRLKSEQRNGSNVPSRVVERTGVGTTGVRLSEGSDAVKLRPKRKARNVGSEAAAAGLVGRAYGSTGESGGKLSTEEIRENRDRFFAETKASRKAARAALPVASDDDARRIAEARTRYQEAVAEARSREATGDTAGASAWMSEARKYRRIFRNK